MTVLPVVAREMNVLARRKSTYWSRTATGLLALLVMLWLLLVSRAQFSFASMGASMFLVLSSICFTFTVLAGMQATSDSVSEEKREGTLGLLFLTDLKGFDVIGGKLAATSFGAVLALMGVIPMLSLALLLGGVTFQQFGLVAVVLANTLFFSLSLGVFVSTLSENERKAMMGTFAGLLIFVVGPYALAYSLRGRFGFVEEIFAISPIYAFSAVHAKPALAVLLPQYFWSSVAFTHLLAWGLLLAAAWILPRYVSAVPNPRLNRVRDFTQNFVYGRIEQRRKHRAELLDRNAFLWLASRERVKPKYAWGIIVFFIGLYIWIASQFPTMMFDFSIAGGIIFLLHLVFKIWTASEVCSRLIDDRRSGALELLLSTPLSVKEIADGQTRALARLFLKPILFLLALECAFFYYSARWTTGSASPDEKWLFYFVAVSSLVVDLWALKWVGLWLSLTGKSIERVLIATLLRILFIPWGVFTAFGGMFGSILFLQRRSPDEDEVMVAWWLISFFIALWFGVSARRKFLSQFRELASRRFESVVEAEPEPAVIQRENPAEKPAKKPRLQLTKWPRRHPVTASIFGAVAAVILFGLLRGWYWERRLESEFARIRQEGYPATAQELVRHVPNVPTSLNAFAMLTDYEVATASRWFPTRKNQTQVTDDELQEMRRLLASNGAVLKALWRLPTYSEASFGASSFTKDYFVITEQRRQDGFMALLEADILDTLHRDGGPDLNRVRNDVFALMTQSRFLRMQPVPFAQQGAQRALHRLSGALGFVFEQDALDAGTLRELQNLAKDPTSNDVIIELSLAVRRAQMFEMGRNPGALMQMGFAVPKPFILLETFNGAIGSRDKSLLELSERFREGMKLIERPTGERIDSAGAFVDPSPGGMIGVRTFMAHVPQAYWTDAAYVANLHVVQAGIAAERYQQKHKKLPQNLDSLVPEFLPAVPQDPYTGEPLRSVLTDHLIIYSVGFDRRDSTAQRRSGNVPGDFVIVVK